jgi:hypothetical protein
LNFGGTHHALQLAEVDHKPPMGDFDFAEGIPLIVILLALALLDAP